MLLSPQDVALFFKLQNALMSFVSQRFGALAGEAGSTETFTSLSPEKRLQVRNDFLKHNGKQIDLIHQFVEENPAHLTREELDIVSSWRHLIVDKFYIFRQLKKYMVFLSSSDDPIAYGVLGLSQPFDELVGPYLPILTEALLLPFKDAIVYDGLIRSYPVSFGPGIRRSLNESFKKAKDRYGIVTTLPMPKEPLPPKTPRQPAKEKDHSLRVVLSLIDRFCQEHLNEEYAVLCRKLAEKLGRKRPSPLMHGSPYVWASGIVRAIGWVNFLHDKSQTPYMRLIDIDAGFGVSESSGAAKLAAIRKMLRIHQGDPMWVLPRR